jgi:hypothetical protein
MTRVARARGLDFAGTQEEAGQIADASNDLDGDAVVYSHAENLTLMCASCWQDRISAIVTTQL